MVLQGLRIPATEEEAPPLEQPDMVVQELSFSNTSFGINAFLILLSKRRLMNKTNVLATFHLFRYWTLILLLLIPSILRGADDIIISSNDLARTIQLSTSVSKLTANDMNSVRDQAWLSFMVEFYKRCPNVPASAMSATYSSYVNSFERLSTVANFPSQYSNPSAPELYNLILNCAVTNLPSDIASYATYAPASRRDRQ